MSRISPHTPPSAEAEHAALVVALEADDLAGADHQRATRLVASCDGCAQLLGDLTAIRVATETVPAPRRTRDFRLTEADATRLQPTRWRALIGWLAAPRSSVRPLAGGLAALGLAGLLLSTVPGILQPTSGATGLAVPASAPAPAGRDAPQAAGSAGSSAPSMNGAAGEVAQSPGTANDARPASVPAPGGPALAAPTDAGAAPAAPAAAAATAAPAGAAESAAPDHLRAPANPGSPPVPQPTVPAAQAPVRGPATSTAPAPPASAPPNSTKVFRAESCAVPSSPPSPDVTTQGTGAGCAVPSDQADTLVDAGAGSSVPGAAGAPVAASPEPSGIEQTVAPAPAAATAPSDRTFPLAISLALLAAGLVLIAARFAATRRLGPFGR
jgi:hypothetical protein